MPVMQGTYPPRKQGENVTEVLFEHPPEPVTITFSFRLALSHSSMNQMMTWKSYPRPQFKCAISTSTLMRFPSFLQIPTISNTI